MKINYQKPTLYDKKVSKEYFLDLRKRIEIDKASILSDTMFKAMFQNQSRIKYPCKLLSYLLDKDYEYLLENLHFTKNEADKEKKTSKSERCDFVAALDDQNINIEMNSNSSKEAMERNIDYIFRLYSGKIKVGDKYNYSKCIQINLNNFAFEGEDDIYNIFYIANEKGTLLTNKIIFILIYIPNLRKKWYTKGVESLQEVERYILTLVEQENEKAKELWERSEFMEEYVKEAEKVSFDDNGFGESYDKELAFKEECYNDGVLAGEKHGQKQKSIEICKLMLNAGEPIDKIIKYTGLSSKEIEACN